MDMIFTEAVPLLIKLSLLTANCFDLLIFFKNVLRAYFQGFQTNYCFSKAIIYSRFNESERQYF